LTALSFAIFGVREWAARLLPLALSAATCPILFVLGDRLAGLRGGALAAILFAFAPGAVYYGQMLDHESFITFLALLSLYAWCRYAETIDVRWFRVCLGLVALTALVDWPGAYLAPALAAASWLSPATRPRAKRMAASATCAAGVSLALVTLHIVILKGSAGDLLESLSFRVFSSPGFAFTWSEYLHRIRINLEYALTPPIVDLAAGGGAALLLLAALRLVREIRGPASRAEGAGPAGGVPPLALSVALGMACSAHHVIFRNACHFNEHLIYYLLPPAILLAAAAPAILERLLRGRLPGRGPATAALLIVAAPLALFLGAAAPQAWSYFNDLSVPGWPLLGQALERVVPEDGRLLSTGSLANPQFLHYLRRARINEVKEGDIPPGGEAGAYLLRDRNIAISPGVESLLAPFPPASVLNFSLYDLRPASPAPEIPALRPAPIEWTPVEIRFGDALLLSMTGHAPSQVSLGRRDAMVRFLGVPWTPDLAKGRIVHASFAWERLEGSPATLVPEYALVQERGGRSIEAPLMWPHPETEKDLARLSPGETERQEIDWFLGEWLPEGEYEVRVSARAGGRLLPCRAGDEGTPRGPYASLGIVKAVAGGRE
jgi:hypothetical protein